MLKLPTKTSRLKAWMRKGRHYRPINLEEYEETTCLNCSTKYRGNYCPGCGQTAKTRRLEMKNAVANFVSIFTNADSKFLHTIIDLFRRPGHMMHDYIAGRRVEYFNPMQMLFFTATILIITTECLGIEEERNGLHFATESDGSDSGKEKSDTLSATMSADTLQIMPEREKTPKKQTLGLSIEASDDDILTNKITTHIGARDNSILSHMINHIDKMMDNQAIMQLTMILLSIFPFKIALNRTKRGRALNIAECFNIQVYMAVLGMIIQFVSACLYPLLGSTKIFVSIISSFYQIWTYKQLLRISFMKTIRVYALSTLLIVIEAAIGVIIIIMLAIAIYDY